MLQWAIEKWDKNQEKLRDYFATHKQEEYCDSYEQLLKKVITYIFNDGEYSYGDDRQNEEVSSEIQSVDFGSYQGSLILCFHYDSYQPSLYETFYTSVEYGSCSGCDALKSIQSYNYEELPTERQLEEYMELCLHLIQNIKQFKEN